MSRFSTEAIARGCARHPWTVITAWVIVLAVSALLVIYLLGSGLTNGVQFTGQPESVRGQKLLENGLAGPQRTNEIVIVQSDSETVDNPSFRDFVQNLNSDITALGPGVVQQVSDYYQTGTARQVSADRHAAIIQVVMAGSKSDAEDNAGQLENVVKAAGSGSFTTMVTGEASIGKAFNQVATSDLQVAEPVGVIAALIILVVVFGTLVAAGIPLLLALVSIVIALGITALTGQVFQLQFFVTNMISMMGLAVGIDYSLFVVSRYREERARHSKLEAIAVAGATASRAVLFSGMTVMLALVGMLLVPSSVFQSLGIGALFVVAVAVLAAVTLLPAVLSLAGDGIERVKIPFMKRHPRHQLEGNGGFWDRASRMVMKHPAISLLLAGAFLIACALPYAQIKVGSSGVSSLPDDLPAKQAYVYLQEHFAYATATPLEVAVSGDIASPAVQGAVTALTDELAAEAQIYGPAALKVNPAGDLALITVPVAGDPTSNEAIQAVRDLREKYIPEAFTGVPAQALVTGETAINADMIDITNNYRPIVFAFVLGLSFILLTVVFHSLVVPLKAIVMDLLSVLAAYGLLVLVFQKGYGARLFGFQQVEKLETWLPLFLFSILFGLSMDYHVFLLSRIRERYIKTGDNAESVAFGMRTTGSIITGAALIMVTVFSGFAAGQLTMFQQIGFGLGAAVLLDATIVRMVVVPAAMQLLGRRNWYLPRWLEWLPDFHVEKNGQ